MCRRAVFPMLILSCMIFWACSKQTVKQSYPQKFEGLTQVVLASQTENIVFTETFKRQIWFIVVSQARVQVNSNVSFDFYVDFEKDGYEIIYNEEEQLLTVNAPMIRVKKPVINQSVVSYPETGILVDEAQEAVEILESLSDRFLLEGENLLKQERVKTTCTEKLQLFFDDLCKKLVLPVQKIEVKFPKAEILAAGH